MKNVIYYLIDRLREPSTYAGVAGLLGAIGVAFSPEQYHAVVGALTALAGVAAVFLPERD